MVCLVFVEFVLDLLIPLVSQLALSPHASVHSFSTFNGIYSFFMMTTCQLLIGLLLLCNLGLSSESESESESDFQAVISLLFLCQR